MKAVLALLLGVAYGNPYSALNMEDAWKEEITYDWENLDHAVAFKSWAQEFGKTYSDLNEESHRFLVFLDNWKMINDHNIADDTSYTLKLNQFGDLTGDEFKLYVHGHKGSCMKKRSVQERVQMIEEDGNSLTAPDSIDWTNYNGASYVTPVKNQGQCGMFFYISISPKMIIFLWSFYLIFAVLFNNISAV